MSKVSIYNLHQSIFLVQTPSPGNSADSTGQQFEIPGNEIPGKRVLSLNAQPEARISDFSISQQILTERSPAVNDDALLVYRTERTQAGQTTTSWSTLPPLTLSEGVDVDAGIGAVPIQPLNGYFDFFFSY